MQCSLDAMSGDQKRAMLARLFKERVSRCVPWQESTVLHELLEPLVRVSNIRQTLRFLSPQDPVLLRQRLQRIVDRHRMLGTYYRQVNNQQVLQVVEPEHAVVFDVVDARHWNAREMRSRLLADAGRPYPLSSLPIFRTQLYRRETEDILQMEVHHAAA
ncbi:MAG: condensation domain-containing protein, partial [Candidatus Xenobia bacterium]